MKVGQGEKGGPILIALTVPVKKLIVGRGPVRSIAFTSAALAVTLPLAALAEAPEEGCYARRYTPEHLAAQPEQVVARMSLWIGGAAGPGETAAELVVLLADQGRARAEGLGGTELIQAMACQDRPEGFVCGVECDGGVMQVTMDEDGSLRLSTDRLLAGGDDCGGGFDLVERIGERVTYRLDPDLPEACN